MMPRWLLRAACLTLLSVTALVQAATPGAGIRARLGNEPVLRGEFVQEKQLQGFKNPLRSKGDFLLARDRGVVWNTRSPFASTLVLTKEKLLVRQADGSTQAMVDQQASPAVGTANALLLALLSGDIDSLSRQFRLRETMAADGSWRLQLVPRQGALKKIFKRIELQGDRHVRSVRLEEVRGDRTELRFLQLRTAPAQLTADEAKQF